MGESSFNPSYAIAYTIKFEIMGETMIYSTLQIKIEQNTNTTKIRLWTHVLQKGMQFLLH